MNRAFTFCQCFSGSIRDTQSRQNGHQGFPQASQTSSFSGSQKVSSSTGNSRLHSMQDSNRELIFLRTRAYSGGSSFPRSSAQALHSRASGAP